MITLINWPRDLAPKLTPFFDKMVILALMICSLTLGTAQAVAIDFEQVIQSFERDFDRIDPILMRSRFESIVVSVSGMAINKDIQVLYKTRGDVKQAVYLQEMERLKTGDKSALVGYEWLLKQLQLLNPNYKLQDILINSFYDNLAGYYLPPSKELIIMKGAPSAAVTNVLFHELVHAAQDTTVDLIQYKEQYGKTADAANAATALLEGQASALPIIIHAEKNQQEMPAKDMLKSILETIAKQRDSQDSGTDIDFLTRMNIFPYVCGLEYVLNKYVNEEQTFSEMLSKVPSSTEQILHPEKFDNYEEPAQTLAEKNIGKLKLVPGVNVLFQTTLGELFIGEMFDVVIGKDPAKNRKAVTGWGGDCILVFRAGENRFFIWDTLWDSTSDAEKFYNHYVDFTRNRGITKKEPKTAGFEAVFSKPNSKVYLKRVSKRVVIIEGQVSAQDMGVASDLLRI